MKTVQLGIAGIGGYAGVIRNLVNEFGEQTNPPVTLTAVCDPNPAGFPDIVAQLERQGVSIYDDYADMLEHDGLDAVWLPVPIDLHRRFTEQALAAGKPVMLEKPVAGCIDDFDAIVQARDAAGLPVGVGFQDVYDIDTLPLKQRLLDGEFGRVQQASVWACWPRDEKYFTRSGWAGATQRGGVWVLDSPLNNALSHFANIAMFLLGPEPHLAAEPVSLQAELYRASAIANYDTVSLRAQLQGGASLTVNFTHATSEQQHPVVRIECEKGVVLRDQNTITTPGADGGAEVAQRPGHQQMRHRMLQRFARAVRGEDDATTALASLEASRPHALLVSGASQATAIRRIQNEHIEQIKGVQSVRGLHQAVLQAGEQHQLLHETGLLDWTAPGGEIDLTGYDSFGGCPDAEAPATA
jgi:predicted dehydrogenase